MLGDISSLVSVLGNFGAWGVLVAYLIWDRQCERKDRKERRADQHMIAEKDILSREKLAASLTSLCMVIQGRPGV